MRWTPTADQVLLHKLIESHDISVDTNKIADAWPASLNGEGPPTARAIKERIAKIRELVKQAAGSTTVAPSVAKRGRVKKNTSSKASPDTKAPARPRKTTRQSTEAVEPEQQSLDNVDHDAELNDLLDYLTQAPNAEDEIPRAHDNPDEIDEEA